MITTLAPVNRRATLAKILNDRKKADAALDNVKKELAQDIGAFVTKNFTSQREACDAIGEPQSQLSLMCSGLIDGFSLERLIRTRALLGAGMAITIIATPPDGHRSIHLTVRP